MAKPPPSEWGKLSAGQVYLPFALDVARAVFSLGLGENVGMLLWHVVEASWGSQSRHSEGWTDPVPVQVSFKELGDLWGIKPQRVYDAKRWLVDSGILIENERGLWVNKNAHKWVKPGTSTPLLDEKKLAHARSARSRSNPSDQHSPTNVTPLDRSVESNVTTLGANGTTLEISRCNVSSHVAERAPGFKSKKLSSSGGSGGGDALLAEIRSRFGGQVAAQMAKRVDEVLTEAGGQESVVLAALEAARVCPDPVRSLPGWCIGFAHREKGKPAEAPPPVLPVYRAKRTPRYDLKPVLKPEGEDAK